MQSFLGRLMYNFQDMYFLKGSLRQGASCRFSKVVRKDNFYSIGASWIITEGKFMQDIAHIQLLKLRTSYGELGNNKTLDADGGANYFPNLSLYETGFNELTNTGGVEKAIDPLLKWEKTASLNLGLDFAFFKQFLNGSIDYYSKESVDLIYNAPLALSTGNSAMITNIGTLKN
jgi:hypothetical protein